jgi:hypothetical protein
MPTASTDAATTIWGAVFIFNSSNQFAFTKSPSAFQPLLQNVVDVWFDKLTISSQFTVEEWNDYNPTFGHGVFLW